MKKLSIITLAFAMMLLCSCTSVSKDGTPTPVSEASAEIQPAPSYDIIGRVVGYGEVDLYSLTDDSQQYTLYQQALSYAIDDMTAKGNEMGMDILLFPSYSIVDTGLPVLKVKASAVAAKIL